MKVEKLAKFIVAIKTYRSKKYTMFAFDRAKDAKGFLNSCLQHGCTGAIYRGVK